MALPTAAASSARYESLDAWDVPTSWCRSGRAFGGSGRTRISIAALTHATVAAVARLAVAAGWFTPVPERRNAGTDRSAGCGATGVDVRLARGPAGAVDDAASGATKLTVAAIHAAPARGALTIGNASYSPAPLLEVAEIPMLIETAAEAIPGSTRATAGTARRRRAICSRPPHGAIWSRLPWSDGRHAGAQTRIYRYARCGCC